MDDTMAEKNFNFISTLIVPIYHYLLWLLYHASWFVASIHRKPPACCIGISKLCKTMVGFFYRYIPGEDEIVIAFQVDECNNRCRKGGVVCWVKLEFFRWRDRRGSHFSCRTRAKSYSSIKFFIVLPLRFCHVRGSIAPSRSFKFLEADALTSSDKLKF